MQMRLTPINPESQSPILFTVDDGLWSMTVEVPQVLHMNLTHNGMRMCADPSASLGEKNELLHRFAERINNAGSRNRVLAIRERDDRWKKMEAVHKACLAADVAVPHDVQKFFGYRPPDPSVVEILDRHPCLSEYVDNGRTGIRLDLSQIHEDTKLVIVYDK